MALHFLEEAFIHLVPPSVPEAIQEENGINILAECPHLEHAAREHSEPYQHHAERTLLWREEENTAVGTAFTNGLVNEVDGVLLPVIQAGFSTQE